MLALSDQGHQAKNHRLRNSLSDLLGHLCIKKKLQRIRHIGYNQSSKIKIIFGLYMHYLYYGTINYWTGRLVIYIDFS